MKKVLVVDDEADFLGIIRTRLEANGYQVETASDGKEALQRIRRCRPDVVFLDIEMPRLGGLDVLREIRRIDKELPIYILTAFSDTDRFGQAKQLKASGFIVKTRDLTREILSVTTALHLAERYRAA